MGNSSVELGSGSSLGTFMLVVTSTGRLDSIRYPGFLVVKQLFAF